MLNFGPDCKSAYAGSIPTLASNAGAGFSGLANFRNLKTFPQFSASG